MLSSAVNTCTTGVVLMMLVAVPVGAEAGEAAIADDSRPDHSDLEADNGWPAGTIQAQLNLDPTTVPFGVGAVFVPAMTNPLDEPPVSIWQGEQLISEGTTGRRLAVLPGRYRVEMGTGAVEQRFSVEVDVRELQISVIPVTWAGLAVHMVDERLNSVRGSYEIIRVDTREYVDVGFGTDEQAGEPVSTWILRPGLYKIVKVGETYRARRDFATVRLLAGYLTDFMLVVDPETDDFQGAGEVPREDLFLAGQGDLWWSFILGGDVNMSSRDNVLGVENGETFSFGAFLDTKVTARIFDSPLILRLQIEEGWQFIGEIFPRNAAGPEDSAQQQTSQIPLQKTQDRADLDGLYVYQLFAWLGPYVRFNIETNLFEGLEHFGKNVRADVYDADGEFNRSRSVRTSVRLLPSFGLTSINEGIGMHVRPLKTLWAETNLGVGFGARHQITNRLIEATNDDVFVCDEWEAGELAGKRFPGHFVDSQLPGVCRRSSDNEWETDYVAFYQQVPPTHQIGVEATLTGILRITRWVLVSIELYGLIPFFDSRVPFHGAVDFFENVVFDVDATLALKLTRFVSINYTFRYLRDPSLSVGGDPNRFENDVRVRFSLDLP